MNKKIVIIGGGIAGLSAGIYGRMHGFDTEVIEMHTVPGGQCTAWERQGYRFDYCLHWLVGTAQGVFHDIWRETDVITEQVNIFDHDVHSVMYDEQGRDFIIYADIDRWERYLIETGPEDAASIKKMCSDMKKMSYLEPFRNPSELRGFWETARALLTMAPQLLLLMKYRNLSCREYFQTLGLKNPRLSYFFDNLFAEHGFSAIAFLMMLGWFHRKNAGYLIGWSLPLASRMADKYTSLGGTLTLGKRVTNIIVENGAASGVLLSDGSTVPADYVISSADGHATLFDMLGGAYLTPEIREAYDSWPLFTPLVQVSFGINVPIPFEYPNQTYLAKGTRIGSTTLEDGYSTMNYRFDPTMAPAGKSVIVLRYTSPWELWKDLDNESYRAEKKRIETDAVALLEKQLPGITAQIEVIDIATPRTGVRYTGVWKGSYEGFLPTSRNVLKTLKMTLPGLNNFYLCGQWLFPGGGLPPAAQSGKWAVQLIAGQNRRRSKK